MDRMGRPREEETILQTIRLPVRLLKMIRELGTRKNRSLNAQIWIILEDWLVEQGLLKNEERRRR